MFEALILSQIAMNLLALFTILLRPRLYKTKLYRPMLTNIRLSVTPIFILVIAAWLSLTMVQTYFNTGNAAFFVLAVVLAVVGFLFWLLFLPNAGYLITELNFNHRSVDTVEVPIWYDIVSVLSLAVSGILNMCFNVLCLQYLAVAVVSQLFQANMTGLWADGISVLLLIISSFGIYLGRYLRLNSWDIRHPLRFLSRLKQHYAEAGVRKNCFLFVLFHSLFFIVFYYAVYGGSAGIIFQNLARIWA